MIILSGASGFIGRRLAAQLAATRPSSDLRCLVRAGDDAFGENGRAFLKSQSIYTVPTELITGQGLEGLRSPDLLFHLAANTHTWERDQGCNDLGTENLLRALGPLGPRHHVVFTSTTAVMDNRNNLDEPLRPDLALMGPPFSRYGRTKWRAEEFLRREARARGFRLSILRLCTVYGPGPRPNSFFDVLKQEVARRSVVSRLDWPALTSFIHVDDVVAGLLKAVDDPPLPGEPRTCLLATESRTLAEVARLIYRARGLPYAKMALPQGCWKLLRHTHRLCRWGTGRLPAKLYNFVWRFNLLVNPVFHCDAGGFARWLPDWRPRLMAECIGEI